MITVSSLFFTFTAASGANITLYILVGLVVMAIFTLLISVGDNLLAIEAKNSGADKTGQNTSILPRRADLLRPKTADHINADNVTFLKQGHDILLKGAPENKIIPGRVTRFALQPPNFIGMSPIPKVTVEVGDTVKVGDVLYFDKKRDKVLYTAPVSGEVIEINRGAKRSISEIVILADKDQQYKSFEVPDLETASRSSIVETLLESGTWPLIRQRPFNSTPEPDSIPRDVFISTFDTAPNAPNTNVLVEGRELFFQKGIDVLSKLTSGHVHLGVDARSKTPPSRAFKDAKNARIDYFHGKHPAGNVGVHIHHIAPLGTREMVWTLGVQEVITIGSLFWNGKLDTSRLVALTGGHFNSNHYVRTFIGARVGDLIKDNVSDKDHQHRLIAGDVLSGHATWQNKYLGVFDDQISILKEGNEYEMFGWLLPITPRPTISKTFPNFLFPDLKFDPDTNTHGEKRAFVVTGEYESVLPMDLYPQHIFKSILINDFERIEGLGTYELVEEDVALCEFVCTSKQPLQKILRDGLDFLREQS